ncbi:sulfatase-like hydrolase/transferase [Myxococcota bacterium]|nr:sulfatase-like hydrolase/transferase [Myxococcota bacterium]
MKSKPNLLFISIDTTRADRIGAYGYGLAQTKTIDRLAKEGVLFEDASTIAPITLPAHASMMTGLTPPAHGVRDNGAYALSDKTETLAEKLLAKGYLTHAIVSAAVLDSRYNLDQGFEGYEDDLWGEEKPPMFMVPDRPAAKTQKLAQDQLELWAKKDPAKPFFMWVHFFDPHRPWKPKATMGYLTATAYDAEIASVDESVEAIIRTLKKTGDLENTIIVFVGDHGESLGEHGEKTHGLFVYQSTIHVPLIIHYPAGLPAGKRYKAPVSIIDIAPTVLGVMGFEPAMGQGRDLLPAILGKVTEPQLPIYAESMLSQSGFGMAPLFSMRLGSHKYIRVPRAELYDLKTDAKEESNLFDAKSEKVLALQKELDAWLVASEKIAPPIEANPMDAETTEVLMALGYLAPASERKSFDGIDPKDGVLIHRQLEKGRHLCQRKKWKEAQDVLEAVIKDQPTFTSALNTLGMVHTRLKQPEKAIEVYKQSLSADPHQYRMYAALANIALKESKFEDAKKLLEKTLNLAPEFAEGVIRMGFVTEKLGDKKTAKEHYKKALAIDPHVVRVFASFGDHLYENGNYPDALRFYNKTLEHTPDNFRALIGAGSSAQKLSDLKSAGEFYAQAQKAKPDTWIGHYNVACIAALTGQTDEAFLNLERALNHGFKKPKILRADPDFKSLHKDERFKTLLKDVVAVAKKMQEKKKEVKEKQTQQ